jgi:dTDP-4-dehydrorhamnose reductase
VKRSVDVLIVGGDGLIGRALAQQLRADGLQVAVTSRRGGMAEHPVIPLNLAQPIGTAELPKAGCIVIAAAETRIAQCQADPAATAVTNTEAPRRLAHWARECGARPLLLSTSAVLDGTRPMAPEDEPQRPSSVYGKQKAAAEQAVLASQGAVLRLGKVLHPEQATLAGWRRDLRSQRAIAPFSDLIMAPVSLDLAVRAIAGLIANRDAAGIFQLTANRALTYAEAAFRFASALGAARELVIPTTSEEAGVALAERPLHATLSDARLRAATGLAAPPPEEAIVQSAAGGPKTD